MDKHRVFEYLHDEKHLTLRRFMVEVYHQYNHGAGDLYPLYRKPKYVFLDVTWKTEWPDLLGVEELHPQRRRDFPYFQENYKGRSCWYWRAEPGYAEGGADEYRKDFDVTPPSYVTDREPRRKELNEQQYEDWVTSLRTSLDPSGTRRRKFAKMNPKHSLVIDKKIYTVNIRQYMAWLVLGVPRGRKSGVVGDWTVRMCRNKRCICPWHMVYLRQEEIDKFFLDVTARWNWKDLMWDNWIHKLEEFYGYSKEEIAMWSNGIGSVRTKLRGFDI